VRTIPANLSCVGFYRLAKKATSNPEEGRPALKAAVEAAQYNLASKSLMGKNAPLRHSLDLAVVLAAEHEDIVAIREFHRAGANFSSPVGFWDKTVLIALTMLPRHNEAFVLEVLRMQLESGSGVVVCPLQSAARYSSGNVMQAFIDAGAEPSDLDRFGHSAIHNAANRGNSSALAVLLLAGADPHQIEKRTGRSVLDSVENGRKFAVGDTSSYFDCVALLQGKISPETFPKDRRPTPFGSGYVAASDLCRMALALLRQEGDRETLVAEIKRLRQPRKVKTKRPLVQSVLGQALCNFALWDVPAALKLMQECGASLDQPNCRGETPLSIAKAEGNSELECALRGMGAIQDVS
jgi:hypothetical protein